MKYVSYVIYKDDPKLFNWYLRGLYFNARLIEIMLPDYRMLVGMESGTIQEYTKDIHLTFGVMFHQLRNTQRCGKMLERIINTSDATHVLCRDADSAITWREVKEIRKWEESGKNWHGINDNPAHSIPMMGGLIGFKPEAYRKLNLTPSGDFSKHGSDQDWIMKNIYPHAKHSFYHSVLTNREPQPDTDPRWESDLVQRYIGSAGVIEMEMVRFLSRYQQPHHTEFEKRHPNIFYWHL
jgi:hypothetical protein